MDTNRIPPWARRPTRREWPISAWRGWHLRLYQAEGAVLTSLAVFAHEYEGPVATAHMRPVELRHGVASFSAGIYAVKGEFLAEMDGVYRPMVIGKVDLWGRVAEFELGYQAEKAMITRLYLRRVRSPHTRIMDLLSRRYDCDVSLCPEDLEGLLPPGAAD